LSDLTTTPPPPPSRLAGWRRRAREIFNMRTAVAAFAAVLIAAVWITTLTHAHYEEQDAIEQATRTNANLTRAFEEHSFRTIKNIDQLTLLMKSQYEQRGRRFDLAQFFHGARINPEVVRGVFVFDERGNTLLHSEPIKPISVADREHFRIHVARDSGRLFINKPVLGRVSGQWLIAASRRINKPDGSFGGVVSVSIDPSYFANFYKSIDLGRGGVVMLAGRDGYIRARVAEATAEIPQEPWRPPFLDALERNERGSIVAASTLDGVTRIYNYCVLPEYPLFVAVGVSLAETLTPVREHTHESYLGAAIASAVIMLGAGWLIALSRRERRALTALLDSQYREQALFDSMTDLAWLKDTAGRYLAISRSFAQITGLQIRDIIGKDVCDIVPRAVAEPAIAEDQRVVATGMPLRTERKGVFNSGWREIIKTPVKDEAGRVVAIAAVSRDITERKRLEQNLGEMMQRERALFDSIDDWVWAKDAAGRYVTVNRSFAKALGREPGEIIGKTCFELRAPDQAQRWDAEDRVVLQSGQPLRLERESVLDGTWRDVIKVPIRDGSGRLTGIAGISRDITERKLAEQHRQEAERRQRDALVREVHHRIKNHLQGVAGLLSSLAREHPEVEPLIERAIAQVQSVALVHGLQGQWPNSAVVLCNMVAEISALAEHVTHAQVTVEVSRELERPLQLDERAAVPVALILNELMLNAVKHAPPADKPQQVLVTVRGDREEAQVSIVNPGALPPGFDFATGTGIGTGLELAKSLLPARAAQLTFSNTGRGVEALLVLRAPIIGGEVAAEAGTN
jgi:PAS domain S-box-containing protein